MCGPRRAGQAVPTTFIDVILPLAVPGTFTYAVPMEAGPVAAGMRVVVPFGRGRKLYTGLVRRVLNQPDTDRVVREVYSVLDTAPVMTVAQLELLDRIADHYLCTPGEVMLASMPGQLVLTSASRLIAVPGVPRDLAMLGREGIILDALDSQEVITMQQAGELLGVKDPMPTIKKLIDAGVVMLFGTITDEYRPRTERFVQLADEVMSEQALHSLFDRLERAPRQLHVLMKYVELSRCLTSDPQAVKREELLRSAGASPAILRELVTKEILLEVERPAEAERLRGGNAGDIQLTEQQSLALHTLKVSLEEKQVVLLRGITSSGKTELYVKLITDVMVRGGQVLYLLPEIALTTQVIGRLEARFGDGIAVYHSRLSARDRTQLWYRMLDKEKAPPIVVGARSALFLPFQKLQLVVVDEEHDTSYKQHDPAPRYNARDMAIVLAQLHQAQVVLGSATPSMESLHNARTGKYGHVELLVRHGEASLPQVQRVDLRDAQRRKKMKGHLSQQLVDAVQEALARKEQAILFQNRRGYVPVWQCEVCEWIPECEHCDVSLTYHKQQHGLRCHYCGREYAPPTTCRSCGSARLRMIGFGTEKIEEEVQLVFPDARVGRLDQDTTRGRHAFNRILSHFSEGAIDILVGTQMVTKGLDMAQVSVVGVLNADNLLRYPDMRAHERAFQLMTQVAGRSGRRNDPGLVILQARDINHPVIGLVLHHDVEGFYQREIELRRAHFYPPFSRTVGLTLKHRMEDRVVRTAEDLAVRLRSFFDDRVLGPEAPPVARVRDRHLRRVMLKLRKDAYQREKKLLRDVLDELFAMPEHSPIQLVIDVDPM